MKRSTSNILTIVLTSVVLLAGALFALFILPMITDDSDGRAETFSAEVNTPQEIVKQVPDPIECSKVFPYSYANHKQLSDDSLTEDDSENRKTFLALVSKQIDILFNVKIDSIVLEKYTQVWRYNGEPNLGLGGTRTDNLYFVDILFTDAKLTQWRITSAGYVDDLLFLSCMENQEDNLTEPIFQTDIPDHPIKAVPDDKMSNAIARFQTKLYSIDLFPDLFGGEETFQPLDLYLYHSNSTKTFWVVHLEYNGRYLFSGYSKNGNVPVCYSYINFFQETGRHLDIFYSQY